MFKAFASVAFGSSPPARQHIKLDVLSLWAGRCAVAASISFVAGFTLLI